MIDRPTEPSPKLEHPNEVPEVSIIDPTSSSTPNPSQTRVQTIVSVSVEQERPEAEGQESEGDVPTTDDDKPLVDV